MKHAGRPDLAAIRSLEPVAFAGLVYRAVPELLRDSILSTEGNRDYSGRYHVAGESGILYTSLDPDVALDEISRHASRREMRWALVTGTIQIRLERVLDLTRESALTKLNLSSEALVSPDHSITQALSLHARKAGFQGLLVPSAAGRGTNLIVFQNHLGPGCQIEIKAAEV